MAVVHRKERIILFSDVYFSLIIYDVNRSNKSPG